ncbi:MAG TPA: hypothetical protein VF755_26250 [Catenuloplanes sp.]
MSRTRSSTVGFCLAVVVLSGCSAGGRSGTMPAADNPASTAADTPAGPPGSPSGPAATTPGPPPTPDTVATPERSATGGRPPLSNTSPPTLPRPSRPPKTPTDTFTNNGWIAGTVVKGGEGPCYQLQTDDGVEYAMHSTAGMTLTRGSRIRVRVSPATARIHCGPGHQVQLDAAEPIR